MSLDSHEYHRLVVALTEWRMVCARRYFTGGSTEHIEAISRHSIVAAETRTSDYARVRGPYTPSRRTTDGDPLF